MSNLKKADIGFKLLPFFFLFCVCVCGGGGYQQTIREYIFEPQTSKHI